MEIYGNIEEVWSLKLVFPLALFCSRKKKKKKHRNIAKGCKPRMEPCPQCHSKRRYIKELACKLHARCQARWFLEFPPISRLRLRLLRHRPSPCDARWLANVSTLNKHDHDSLLKYLIYWDLVLLIKWQHFFLSCGGHLLLGWVYGLVSRIILLSFRRRKIQVG